MHLPLVMALQVALSDIALHGLVKLALILAISFAILLGTYQLLVRHTWIGGWLNGRRAGKDRSVAARIPADASV